MRTSSRRSDDADVIRARLRLLLDEAARDRGWVPAADPDDDDPETARRPDDDPDRAEDPAPTPGDGLPERLGRHRAPGAAVRVAPGRRGVWALWLVALLAAALVALATWSDRPQVQPAPPAPSAVGAPTDPSGPDEEPEAPPATPSVGVAADASATVVVSVVGLVARPGLVTLPEGARVADAIDAAGGLLTEADPASVNLAARVADGEQVAVGVPGAAPGAGAAPPGAAGSGPLDLNAADVAALDALPGIGPVLAQRIVDHREQVGRFTTVEQLDDVPGIGPAIYAELVDLVAV